MKRLLSLLIIGVMVIGMFAGCNPQTDTDELEPVTLKWFMPGIEKEGTKDVIEAFNAKLAELLPNTTVEFELTGQPWEYGDPWNMALSGNQQMDIAWAGWCTNYLGDVQDGSIMDITDLVEQYAPNLKAEKALWSDSYASCTYEGKLYGIPSIQPTAGTNTVMRFDNEVLVPYIDFEALRAELDKSPKLTQTILDMVDDAFDAAIADGKLSVGSETWNAYYGEITRPTGYVPILDASYGIYLDPDTNQVMHVWEIPEIKLQAYQHAEWFDKGWITEKMILGQMPSEASIFYQLNSNYNNSWYNADENGLKASTENGRAWTAILTESETDAYQLTSSFGSASTYMVIPFTAKNPERAIMLLDLLHGEAGTPGNDLMNLLCYGFEKGSAEAEKYGWYNYQAKEVDGQMVVDTSVRGDAESKHDLTNWVMGNTYKIMSPGDAMTSKGNKEYCEYYWEKVYPNLKKCDISGMAVDTSVIADDLNSMMLVYKEYCGQIDAGCGGTDKVESLMNEALTNLKAAGWDTVKANLESQIAAYKASK